MGTKSREVTGPRPNGRERWRMFSESIWAALSHADCSKPPAHNRVLAVPEPFSIAARRGSCLPGQQNRSETATVTQKCPAAARRTWSSPRSRVRPPGNPVLTEFLRRVHPAEAVHDISARPHRLAPPTLPVDLHGSTTYRG